MKKKITSYLKQKIVTFMIYIAIILIFQSVLFLYNINMDAINYAVLLSFMLLIVTGMIGFVHYVRYIDKVEYMLSSLPYELRGGSVAKGEVEKLYEKRVSELFTYKEDLENNARIGRQEMLDYYSLWAHQIKTPISAMRLLLQSMSGETEEQEIEFLQPMKGELFKTEQYVEMVMSYLRLEDISSDLFLQWYDIDEIVRQAVRKYSQLFILKKIKLQYHACKGKVLTDEKWMLFVIEQLLSNALKYTSSGEISIYMEDSEKSVLVIEDTGIGIQQEDLPRIFEKGFTGFNGRQDKKATGIGLYLCRTVCNKLNHEIAIESEAGSGTKVSINLYRDVQVFE